MLPAGSLAPLVIDIKKRQTGFGKDETPIILIGVSLIEAIKCTLTRRNNHLPHTLIFCKTVLGFNIIEKAK
jgi:hypothetical protein